MPRRYRLYLDTSVPNAYFDEKNLYRQEITRQFWLKLKEYDVFISDLVISRDRSHRQRGVKKEAD